MELQEIQPQVLPQGLRYPAPFLSRKSLPLKDFIDQPERETPALGPVLDGGEPPLNEPPLNLYASERLHAITPKGSIVGKRIEKNFSIVKSKNFLGREMSSNESPGARLKKARQILGLTQKDFGEPLGLKWHQVKDMEAGKLLVRPEIALKIEKVYSINFRWLLTGEGPMFMHEAEPERSLSPDLAEALKKHPTIEKIVLMLAEMSEDDIRDIYKRVEEKATLKRLLKEVEQLKVKDRKTA